MKRINISEAPAATVEPTTIILDVEDTEWHWFAAENVIVHVTGYGDDTAWIATEDEWDTLADAKETERFESQQETERLEREAADDYAYERSLFHQ